MLRSLQLPRNDNDNFRDSIDIMYVNDIADSQTSNLEQIHCGVFHFSVLCHVVLLCLTAFHKSRLSDR